MEKEQTKKCKYCQENISIKASRCPKCGGDLRGWIARHPILFIIVLILTSPLWGAFIFGLFSGASGGKTENNSSPKPERKEVFNASVFFNGSQFEIDNLESVDCVGSRMEVNGGLLKDGFSLNDYTLEAGQSYAVGAMQFVDKNGNRFNPFSKKPQSISIYCRGENLLTGSVFYGELQ